MSERREVAIGQTVLGRPIEAVCFSPPSYAKPRPPAILFGAMHGDEPVSQLMLDGLIRAEAYLQNDIFASAVLFAGSEGIIPAPEAAHAIHGAIEVARQARTILGANGVTLEYPVIRHVNNLESVLTYEGTHEVHTLVVGNALTGENAFR